VNRLQISAVTPNRHYLLDVIDPADSGPARVTVYTGVVTVVANPGFRGIIRSTDVEPFSFFLPDAPPVTALPSQVEVETSVRSHQATTGDGGGAVFVGAVQPRVAVAPDPREGGGGPWLQVSFGLHPVGTVGCELNYRVSVWA
jgi:hypothetical protein